MGCKMTKQFDGEPKRPTKPPVKPRSKNFRWNNIYDFAREKRKPANEASTSDARRMEAAQISHMVVALEPAIENVGLIGLQNDKAKR